MGPTDPRDLQFHDALGELHSLVLGVAEVETFLEEVATLATGAVETEVSCGITTRHDHRPAAFDLLRQRSQSANRRMRDVATELVERVSGHPVSGPSPFEDPGGAGAL